MLLEIPKWFFPNSNFNLGFGHMTSYSKELIFQACIWFFQSIYRYQNMFYSGDTGPKTAFVSDVDQKLNKVKKKYCCEMLE